MQKVFRSAGLAASVAALAFAPAAMAQGGSAGGGGGGGGGVATGGVATGGSVSTGGNKGGVKDPIPVAGCATLTSVSAPVGYYSTFAALWNDYSVKSCATGSQTVNVVVTNTNVATGAVDFTNTLPYTLTAGQGLNGVMDNDFAPFSTAYNVTIAVRDGSNGNVLDTRSLTATTPDPR